MDRAFICKVTAWLFETYNGVHVSEFARGTYSKNAKREMSV